MYTAIDPQGDDTRSEWIAPTYFNTMYFGRLVLEQVVNVALALSKWRFPIQIGLALVAW